MSLVGDGQDGNGLKLEKLRLMSGCGVCSVFE